jgi:hypothetical protein
VQSRAVLSGVWDVPPSTTDVFFSDISLFPYVFFSSFLFILKNFIPVEAVFFLIKNGLLCGQPVRTGIPEITFYF